ncbi:MAG: WD40/YVTN/BNR-like repeat-containing protein, partial [Pyrinomonadaceae bacterium]
FFINQKTGWSAGADGKIYATMNGGKYWREQNSTITKSILDIFFLNTAEGYAVGDDGTILHTTTAGNTWKTEESNVKHKLERVFFNGRGGFAVGFGGTILKYEAEAEKTEIKPQPKMQRRNN